MRTQKSLSVMLALALVGLWCAGLALGSEAEPAMAIENEIARDLADELQAVSIDELDAPLPLGADALVEADATADADAQADADSEGFVEAETVEDAELEAEGEADTEAEGEVEAGADAEVDSERRRRRRGNMRGQRFAPGDRVSLTVRHRIKALCARRIRGSKTVYTGKICPNGNIEWQGMRTINPRRGLSPSACQWSREGAAPAWIDDWVGTCDRAPSKVPQLRFLKPKRYRNLVLVSRADGSAVGAGAGAAAGAGAGEGAGAGGAAPALGGAAPALGGGKSAPAIGTDEPGKKQFPPPVNQPPHPGAEAYDCFIKQGKCPNYPQYVGQFKDPFTASYSQAQCFARAKWFHAYCGNSEYMSTTAVWGKTGRSYRHTVWHTGDRVQLAVQHNIPALCGKVTGSTTVYYGSICANGNIQWEWMRTNDPPTGFTSRQCTWRKAASSDYAWIMQWFGDCDTPPTMVPGIKKLHPTKFPGLKREWYRAGDRVQYEMVTRSRGLCAKPEGSKVLFLGTICDDGKHVEWQRIKVLDPRPGVNPKECRFRRDNAPKHIHSLYFGKCTELPKDLPELKTTVAVELLPTIRRGWFKPGDEVYTVLKTKIGALCAAATGSTTTYRGVVCENGNVQWNSMSTSDPRPPYTQAQCSWSRAQTTSKKWLDMWLGSCNAPPPGVPQLTSAYPGDLPAVLQDKNTCTKNSCSANAVCIRVFPSSHTCQCKPGFQGDGVNCGEIDNCASNPCHKQAYCKKTGPGKHECKCHSGFEGDGKQCAEVDNCKKNPCDANADCKKTGPGAHVCECHKGYRMQNGVCTEINACALQPCDPNATCKKTGPGSYSCTCNKGYIGDGKFCREKNDCDRTPAPCSAYAKCTRTGPGKHKCECKAGFKGDGLTCEEVDACAAKPCDKHGVCRRTGPGKHVCTCVPGYKKKKGFKDACEEVNNCDKKPCDKNAKCKKTGPGIHTCTCKKGFKGDGMTCDPIDACESHPCPLNSVCRTTGPGTFACQCKPGYRRKGQLCVEKDGCASNPCDPRAKCHKTGPGTHVCVCGHGYNMVGNKCEEIDACEKNPCSLHSDCVSTGPNKYKCVCKKGFTGDGVTCKEVDACELKPSPCDKNADCTKTGPGLFKCTCRLGYTGSGVKCEESNPCIPNNPCDKNAFCTKTGPGKYSCQCNKGFTKFGDSCLEVDACLSHPCDRNAECERTGPGTFGCHCKSGFEGNGFVCAEINACLSSPCDKHAYCQRDGPNKYKCLCQRGYKMGPNGACEEINACKQVPYPCDQHATCTSTGPNAFLCTCKVGFQMNAKQQCEEVDPCASNPCERTAICTAVRSKIASPDGEYRLKAKCSCMPGYKANLEGKCVAVDPCASSPCDVHAVCQKTGLEDYTCRCKPGYVMNPKTQTCDEIDACVSKPCPLNSLCIKTGPALFTCVCNAGYKMDKTTGMCAEADSCLSGPCGAHAICQKTGPGTHTCNCVPGYVMEGANTCVADDNLVTRQLKASANEARAKKQLEDELEAQRRKLELEKLAELAALRQKEELRRFGDRLDAFLRQRRVKREFVQDHSIDEIQARIEDLEHAAQVLVKNSEQQSALAREVLAKKQAEHHVVARKQLIQHKHDLDLLALMKRKVDDMLSKTREEAEQLYKAPMNVHGYNPNKPAPAPAPPKPVPAQPAAANDAASLFEDESEVSLLQVAGEGEGESESEQKIMVDEQGVPVLPMSEPVDLNTPLDPIMTVPKADAPAQAPQPLTGATDADLTQDAPTQYPRFVSAEDSVDSALDTTEELGSVSPVEQVAELPTPESVAEAQARFQQQASEVEADNAQDESAEPSTFKPEMSDDRLSELPLEAELV